jgi:DNA polymerase III epsilon subunit-like protein
MKGRTLFSSLLAIAIPVPEKITEITGIDDSMLKGKPSFDAVYEDISEILRGRTVLGWNVAFDIQMLQIECDRLGYRTPIEGCTDVMALYGIATAGKKWCKLAKAAEELSIEGEQEHRSLGDCLMTLEVMKRFVAETPAVSESEKLRDERNLRIVEDAELPF